MLKRVSQGVVGGLLLLVFVGWLWVRHWEPVAGQIGMDSILGWAVWSASFGCLLGGVALLAKAVFTSTDISPDK